MSELGVVHNAAQSRFEITVDGLLCRADYHLVDGVMQMTHTVVPPALGGRGIAGKLVAAAFEYATAQGYKVEPVCSYVRTYMQKNAATQALLPAGYRL